MDKRSISVGFIPPFQDGKTVRFAGSTFGDLRARLSEARIPGMHERSYLEVYLPAEDRFVCLLDEEELPAGDLSVNIFLEVSGERLGVMGQQPSTPGKAEGERVRVTGPDPPLTGKQARWMEKLDKKLQKREAKSYEKMAKIASKLEKSRLRADTFTRYGPAAVGQVALETGIPANSSPNIVTYPTLDARDSNLAAFHQDNVQLGLPVNDTAGHGQPVFYKSNPAFDAVLPPKK